MKILFTCSSGGHLTELLQLNKIIIQNKSYLLTETNQLHNNLFEKVFKVQQINRKEKHFLFYFVKLFLKSRKIYNDVNPEVIISTGALVTVPICILAKLHHKKIEIFLYNMFE